MRSTSHVSINSGASPPPFFARDLGESKTLSLVCAFDRHQEEHKTRRVPTVGGATTAVARGRGSVFVPSSHVQEGGEGWGGCIPIITPSEPTNYLISLPTRSLCQPGTVLTKLTYNCWEETSVSGEIHLYCGIYGSLFTSRSLNHARSR